MTNAKGPQEKIAIRLNERLDYLAISQSELARRSGIPRDQISRLARNLAKRPQYATIEALAQVLKVSPDWLAGYSDDVGGAAAPRGLDGPRAAPPAGHGAPRMATLIPVVGTVEAGAFRPVSEMVDEATVKRIEASRHERFANFHHFAFDVHGDSMNLAGISEGDHVICVDWVQVGMMEMSGLTVVVERTINGGHLREWTVKEMEVFPDKILLHPRSTNLIHQPIVIDRDHSADNGTEIKIIGLVVRVMKNVFPF